MIRLSKASKMPGKSWSLQARETCPGSIDPATKTLLPVCAGCYATQGKYVFPSVKAPREENRKDWKREDWVSDMVAAIAKEKFFRWFDSGDVYHPGLAEKIYYVMEQTPHIRHWLPTKSYNIPKIRFWLNMMKELPNVAVRFSSPTVDGMFSAEHGSCVVPSFDSDTQANAVCDAYERDGKCGDCRVCWDKTVDVVAYVAHSKKLIKQLKAAA